MRPIRAVPSQDSSAIGSTSLQPSAAPANPQNQPGRQQRQGRSPPAKNSVVAPFCAVLTIDSNTGPTADASTVSTCTTPWMPPRFARPYSRPYTAK